MEIAMPQDIRTPEEIFRAERKDLYIIRFKPEEEMKWLPNPPGRKELLAWFTSNLPSVRIEPLAPSEQSGILSGYDGSIRVDFDQDSLAAYSAHWEDAEGASVDSRWQCDFTERS
jgi:hypothetical protein